MREIRVTTNDAGRRLDRFLRKYLRDAGLAAIYRMIRKDVKVNGRREKENYILQNGDLIALYVSESDLSAMTGSGKRRGSTGAKRTFGIAYEDDDILIADKPCGLLTHGDVTEKKSHLANQVRDYLIETGDYDPREKVFSPAPANRLDRNTTGLVLFGKNSEALRALTGMIRDGRITKYYRAIVFGVIDDELDLTGRLIKDEAENKATILDVDTDEGKEIRTIVRPVAKLNGMTLVEIELATGRTHQIRVHMASIGHPVMGDGKYTIPGAANLNGKLYNMHGISTQLLHSAGVEFTGEEGPLGYLSGRRIDSDVPGNFERVIRDFGGLNRK